MQLLNKYQGKSRIGVGWIVGSAAVAILVAVIGLTLSNHGSTAGVLTAPASNVQPAPAVGERTLADIMHSGQYPFGASGFDSVPPRAGAARAPALADIASSGHYPFGAGGFDSLLKDER